MKKNTISFKVFFFQSKYINRQKAASPIFSQIIVSAFNGLKSRPNILKANRFRYIWITFSFLNDILNRSALNNHSFADKSFFFSFNAILIQTHDVINALYINKFGMIYNQAKRLATVTK